MRVLKMTNKKDVAPTPNMRTVSPSEAIKSLMCCLDLQMPSFLWGPPGIGKSDIVKLIGKKTGRQVIDIRLNLWEPTDVKGIPHLVDGRGMVWSPPAELPTDPDCDAIIIFDELPSAPPAVQAATYQLFLDRAVGEYVLPPKVSLIAAGNRAGDRGVTYQMPSPLANRFVHLELKVNFDDWQEWAIDNSIHPQVIGYLGWAKNNLHDTQTSAVDKAFRTPRTWSFVSKFLYYADDKKNNVDIHTLHTLVAGCIGEGAAVEFMSHREIAGQLPTAEEIIFGKVDTLKVKEISAMYSLTVILLYELKDRLENKEAEWDGMFDKALKFMAENFPPELLLMGIRTSMQQYKFPLNKPKLPYFSTIQHKYSKYFITALAPDA